MRDKPIRTQTENTPSQKTKRSDIEDEDIKIHDYSDLPDYDKQCGLSDEQVSRIAADILQAPSYRYSFKSARRS